ncbi:MAG: ATP-dependent DNA helicase RecG [Candidatus Marinimicrobia bacterium]|nr:ATP-dependent DNA helicase RecG [Candidatus Neomarinimicrobiota bacterium]MCF7828439.1 ATP-dependent DNA helicase RecG [Candidatus Neomarinimicrobiota bacterium]MCF7880967.1 ATP-dependent DNA helicase RecG [Candidatus Neomarinimicrobiota bacterium]
MSSSSPDTSKLQPDSPVQYLKGVGPKRAEALESFDIETLEDLLYFFPRRYLDRSTIVPINQLKVDQEATVVGKVMAKGVRKGRRRSYFELVVEDKTGMLKCRWFRGVRWIKNAFKTGEPIAVSGKVAFYNGLSMSHPDYDKLGKGEEDPVNTGKIIPLYPGSQKLKRVGLDSRRFRRIYGRILPKMDGVLPEYLPQKLRSDYNLQEIELALRGIHAPADQETLGKAKKRLKFEELFFIQLMLALRKHHFKKEPKGISYEEIGPLCESLYRILPFELTEAQKQAMREIRADMKSKNVMNRLLQGDVGSGKTVVAMLAASIAVGNGYQVAFMAPTEILAEQHYRTVQSYFRKLKVPVALLTGSQKGKDRKSILNGLKHGDIPIVVGTHALIQEGVAFDSLGLAIIDEQHRFGVLQRGELSEKGDNIDVLVMTATPIPRTMALTIYGDLDVSTIDELPAGRKQIVTRKVSVAKLDKVYEFVKQELSKGRQCYVVYPLVEESEKMDLQAATQGYEYLQEVFSEFTVGLLHGRMKADEKEEVMARFEANEIQMLVSTTVIEVGIDVPNATIMLIENAERFGLTQLHQLRGRVGRGEHQSFCILVNRNKGANNGTAEQRLSIMVETSNGFKIADEDLKIRGPGEMFGTKQSGFPDLKIADFIDDADLLYLARNAAFDLVKEDPKLRNESYANLKTHFVRHYKKQWELSHIS